MRTTIESLAKLDEKLWRSGCLLFLVLVFAVIFFGMWMLTVEVRLSSLEEKVSIDRSSEQTHGEEDQAQAELR